MLNIPETFQIVLIENFFLQNYAFGLIKLPPKTNIYNLLNSVQIRVGTKNYACILELNSSLLYYITSFYLCFFSISTIKIPSAKYSFSIRNILHLQGIYIYLIAPIYTNIYMPIIYLYPIRAEKKKQQNNTRFNKKKNHSKTYTALIHCTQECRGIIFIKYRL